MKRGLESIGAISECFGVAGGIRRRACRNVFARILKGGQADRSRTIVSPSVFACEPVGSGEEG